MTAVCTPARDDCPRKIQFTPFTLLGVLELGPQFTNLRDSIFSNKFGSMLM